MSTPLLFRNNWEIQITNFQGLFFTLYSALKTQTLNILDINVSELVTQFIHHTKMLALQENEFAFITTYFLMVVELLELKSRCLNKREKQRNILLKELDINELHLLKEEHKQFIKNLQTLACTPRIVLKNTRLSQQFLPKKLTLKRESIQVFPKVLNQLFVLAKQPQTKLTLKTTSLNLFAKSKWILTCLKTHSHLNIMSSYSNKQELITIFLVSLDLAKHGKLYMSQDIQFGKIKVVSSDGFAD